MGIKIRGEYISILLLYDVKGEVMRDFSLKNPEKNMTIEEFMEMVK